MDNSDPDNFYNILDITQLVSTVDVKRAYKKQIIKYNLHNPINIDTDLFVRITQAYYILSNQQYRKIYDLHGYQGLLDNDIYVFDIPYKEIYENVFPISSEHSEEVSLLQNSHSIADTIKKSNIIHLIEEISIHDVYNGKYVTESIQRLNVCSNCHGTGSDDGHLRTCKKCRGKKVLLMMDKGTPKIIPCQYCHETGLDNSNSKVCHKCQGQRTEIGDYSLKFLIYVGIKDNEIITIKDSGNINLGNNTRDDILIHVKLIIDTSQYIIVEDADHIHMNVEMKIHVSLVTVLTGLPFNIQLPRGTTMVCQYDKILEHNEILIIDNEGIPEMNNKTKCGKLLLIVNVDYPKILTEEQKQKLREILT